MSLSLRSDEGATRDKGVLAGGTIETNIVLSNRSLYVIWGGRSPHNAEGLSACRLGRRSIAHLTYTNNFLQ